MTKGKPRQKTDYGITLIFASGKRLEYKNVADMDRRFDPDKDLTDEELKHFWELMAQAKTSV